MTTNYQAQQYAAAIQYARAAIAQGSTPEAAARAYGVPVDLLAPGLPPIYGPLSGKQTAALAARGAMDTMVRVIPSDLAISMPPAPHPDASNLALGPNLGGQDAVVDPPGTGAGVPGSGGTGAGSSGMGGLLLIGGAVILAVVLLGRK